MPVWPRRTQSLLQEMDSASLKFKTFCGLTTDCFISFFFRNIYCNKRSSRTHLLSMQMLLIWVSSDFVQLSSWYCWCVWFGPCYTLEQWFSTRELGPSWHLFDHFWAVYEEAYALTCLDRKQASWVATSISSSWTLWLKRLGPWNVVLNLWAV